MDKKYQVFVSSTYVDLIEERKAIIQALLEADCIPVGMEMFQASDEEQWAFVKRVITDCDYYVLVIAGRYGSLVSEENISYTEKEFEYAQACKIPILAFIHGDLGAIVTKNTDQNDELRGKLSRFIENVKSKRLIKNWTTTDDLAGKVIMSITLAKKTYPRAGWIKADKASSIENTQLMLELTNENARLKEEVSQQNSSGTNEYACGSDPVYITGEWLNDDSGTWNYFREKRTWDQVFYPIMVQLQEDVELSSYDIYKCLVRVVLHLWKWEAKKDGHIKLKHDLAHTVIIQMRALDFLEKGRLATGFEFPTQYWKLSAKGEAYLIKHMAIKKN